MRILAFESSCDDSACAYLEIKDGQILRLEHVVASQEIHRKYGGVVPEVAAREHSATMPTVLDALAEKVVGRADGLALQEQVDRIAATAGPGLATSLRVGLDTARALAFAWDKPFHAINHIEGHVASSWLPNKEGESAIALAEDVFPALVLVVSGGHTELLYMRNYGEYTLLGSTRDDAAGEAFDKTAKLLGFGYPGGPEISARAKEGDATAYDFPRPMMHDTSHDFSFSGLKTAVRYFIRDNANKMDDAKFISDVSASVEQAIVEVLTKKTVRAAKGSDVKTVLLAGGVSANHKLRESLRTTLAAEASEITFVEPPLMYCTDNAAMIAMAAYFKSQHSDGDDRLTASVNPSWELGRA